MQSPGFRWHLFGGMGAFSFIEQRQQRLENMKYILPVDSPVLNFEEAMLTGLARDGGSYVPETIPSFSDDEIQSMADLSYEETAFKVIAPFVGDCFSDRNMEIIDRAYAGFGHSGRAPLVELENNHFL